MYIDDNMDIKFYIIASTLCEFVSGFVIRNLWIRAPEVQANLYEAAGILSSENVGIFIIIMNFPFSLATIRVIIIMLPTAASIFYSN